MTGRKSAQIENARDRSLWRLNLDDLVVQPAVASSGYPSGEPAAFAAAPSSGCAVFKNLRLAPTALDSGSTGGRLPRLGSAWFRSARPVANLRLASAVARFRSPDGDPSGLRRTIPPPARPTINCRLAPDFDPSARLVEQPPAFAGCCRSFQLALAAAAASGFHRLLPPFAKPAANLRLASAVPPPASPVSIHPACARCFYLRLGLRCAPNFNRTLHRQQAADEYSISAGSRIFRICQL